jgi:hypothetical protein
MPTIKPRTTQLHLARHITRLYRENNETLFAYAAFIGESTEYVLNQLVETVLAKDRDFQQWRTGHPDSHVPVPGSRRKKRPRAPLSSLPVAQTAVSQPPEGHE